MAIWGAKRWLEEAQFSLLRGLRALPLEVKGPYPWGWKAVTPRGRGLLPLGVEGRYP